MPLYLAFILSSETDLATTLRFGRRFHQATNSVDQLPNGIVVAIHSLFEFGKFAREFLVRGGKLPEFHEGPHDEHAYIHGTAAMIAPYSVKA